MVKASERVLRSAGCSNEEVLASPRPLWRRLAHCWGLVPGIGVPHLHVRLEAADGVPLSAAYVPRLPDGGGPSRLGGEPAVILAPGFAGSHRKPAYALLAERLAGVAAVLALDLRGHGASGGRCTLGVDEVHDVTAAAGWLRNMGHGWVGAIGASMGGTAVLRAAGLATSPPFDAVCAISAPAVWGLTDTPPMRAIDRIVRIGWYRRMVGSIVRVRIAAGLPGHPPPAQPVDVVGGIAPAPLLIVHGEDDHYFSAEQARLLVEAAAEPRALWLEPPGFGHAEDGFRPPFADRLARAVAEAVATGSWPGSR